ncbi:MAG: hypothetical protein RLY93_01480 [Sumerlaeia bacterium]
MSVMPDKGRLTHLEEERDGAKEKMRHSVEKIREEATPITDFVRKHPVATVGVVAGAGFLLGAAAGGRDTKTSKALHTAATIPLTAFARAKIAALFS